MYKASKFYIAVDKEIETAVHSFFEALVVTFSFYYMFGINYSDKFSLTMDFIQRYMFVTLITPNRISLLHGN